MVKVFYFDSTHEAYDASQWNDDIRDGDVLVATDENVVGVLIKAWPTAVTGERGSFHRLTGGWDRVRHGLEVSGVSYLESVRVADELIEAHRQALEG